MEYGANINHQTFFCDKPEPSDFREYIIKSKKIVDEFNEDQKRLKELKEQMSIKKNYDPAIQREAMALHRKLNSLNFKSYHKTTLFEFCFSLWCLWVSYFIWKNCGLFVLVFWQHRFFDVQKKLRNSVYLFFFLK